MTTRHFLNGYLVTGIALVVLSGCMAPLAPEPVEAGLIPEEEETIEVVETAEVMEAPELVEEIEPYIPIEEPEEIIPEEPEIQLSPAEQWLFSQPDGSFTLQFIASPRIATVEKFTAGHGLTETAHQLTTNYDGEEWHILVQDSYPGYGAALAAIKELPQGLIDTKPWARSIDALKPLVVNRPPAEPVEEDQPGVDLEAEPMAEPPTGTSPVPLEAGEITEDQLQNIHDANWIWERDPEHYTVELLGSNNGQMIADFTADKVVPLDMAYYHSIWGGRPWFVLIYGDFPSREAAQQAYNELPEELRISEPTLRDFASIHEEMILAGTSE